MAKPEPTIWKKRGTNKLFRVSDFDGQTYLVVSLDDEKEKRIAPSVLSKDYVHAPPALRPRKRGRSPGR